MSLQEVKEQVAIATRILAELGLATGLTNSVGHVSLRLPDDPTRFVVKGRGYEMDVVGLMRPEDLVVVDLDGKKVDGPKGISQCYEVKMHSCILRDHPEVQSVVHVHPRFTILMSVLGTPIRPMSNTGGQLVRRPIPVYPHNHLILTEQHGSEVSAMLGDSKAILLKGHGAATVGASLQESVLNMAHLEEQALLNTWACSLAGPDHPFISEEMMTEARSLPPYETLDHFKDSYEPGRPRPGGTWAYYTEKVAKELGAS
jgi:L-fuculose-phosphate aldolase